MARSLRTNLYKVCDSLLVYILSFLPIILILVLVVLILCVPLLMVFAKEAFVKKMDFLPLDKRVALFDALSSANPVYALLDHTKRTTFLRQTGDNYRLFCLPTRQMSISIMNMLALVSSPHGQLIEKLWRGDKSRTNLKGTARQCSLSCRTWFSAVSS